MLTPLKWYGIMHVIAWTIRRLNYNTCFSMKLSGIDSIPRGFHPYQSLLSMLLVEATCQVGPNA